MLSRISQRSTQAGNGDVQAVVEVNEHIVAPKPPALVIACDHLSRVLQEGSKYLERLMAEANPVTTFAENARGQVDLEAVEADDL